MKKNILTFILISCLAALALTGSCTRKNAYIGGTVEYRGDPLQLPPSAVLYVIARSKRAPEKPPIAVLRIPQPFTLPYQFTLTEKDRRLPGRVFNGPFLLSARISQSGSFLPLQKDDLQCAPLVKPVNLGDQDLKLVLKKIE